MASRRELLNNAIQLQSRSNANAVLNAREAALNSMVHEENARITTNNQTVDNLRRLEEEQRLIRENRQRKTDHERNTNLYRGLAQRRAAHENEMASRRQNIMGNTSANSRTDPDAIARSMALDRLERESGIGSQQRHGGLSGTFGVSPVQNAPSAATAKFHSRNVVSPEPAPDSKKPFMSAGDSFMYGLENIGAGVAGGISDAARYLGSTAYQAGGALTSLGGLAPNKVSDWFYNTAKSYYDPDSVFSAADRWNQSINERYDANSTQQKIAGIEQSAGQMVPSILVNTLVPALGVSEAAASLMSQASFGMSAASASTNEALKSGKLDGMSNMNAFSRANAYGTLAGTLEVATENLAAGVPGLSSEGFLTKVFTKLYDKAPWLETVLDMAGEGVEEVISEALTPYLQRLTYDPTAQHATLNDYVDAFVGGVILSTAMGISSKIADAGTNLSDILQPVQGKAVYDAGGTVDLINEGLSMPQESSAYKNARKLADTLERRKTFGETGNTNSTGMLTLSPRQLQQQINLNEAAKRQYGDTAEVPTEDITEQFNTDEITGALPSYERRNLGFPEFYPESPASPTSPAVPRFQRNTDGSISNIVYEPEETSDPLMALAQQTASSQMQQEEQQRQEMLAAQEEEESIQEPTVEEEPIDEMDSQSDDELLASMMEEYADDAEQQEPEEYGIEPPEEEPNSTEAYQSVPKRTEVYPSVPEQSEPDPLRQLAAEAVEEAQKEEQQTKGAPKEPVPQEPVRGSSEPEESAPVRSASPKASEPVQPAAKTTEKGDLSGLTETARGKVETASGSNEKLGSFASYNPKRYTSPWAGRVLPSGRMDFKSGGFGGERGGSGDTYITAPQEGEVYATGQKGVSETKYFVFHNGRYYEVTRGEALRIAKEREDAKNQPQTQTTPSPAVSEEQREDNTKWRFHEGQYVSVGGSSYKIARQYMSGNQRWYEGMDENGDSASFPESNAYDIDSEQTLLNGYLDTITAKNARTAAQNILTVSNVKGLMRLANNPDTYSKDNVRTKTINGTEREFHEYRIYGVDKDNSSAYNVLKKAEYDFYNYVRSQYDYSQTNGTEPLTNASEGSTMEMTEPAAQAQQNTEESAENAAPVTSATEAEATETASEAKKSADIAAADNIGKLLSTAIETEKPFTGADLWKATDAAYGGTMGQGAYTAKDAYDSMELAVNRYLANSDAVKNGNGDAATAVKTLDAIQKVMDAIPSETKRTAEQVTFQQFSTPPTIAYIAGWAANVNTSDTVLEPSAGIGGLAVFPKAWGADVVVNELSTRRLSLLKDMGFSGNFNENAEHIADVLPDSVKPTVVIMNPPFSSDAGRTDKGNKTSNATLHIESALDTLPDGGRLVAILGQGMADDRPAFKKWWAKIKSENNVRANISISGKNYHKYGTDFGVQMVVIDKGGKTTETLTGSYDNLRDIPAALEGIRNDRTANQFTTAGTNASENAERGKRGVRSGQTTRSDNRNEGGSAPRNESGTSGRGNDSGDTSGRRGSTGRVGEQSGNRPGNVSGNDTGSGASGQGGRDSGDNGSRDGGSEIAVSPVGNGNDSPVITNDDTKTKPVYKQSAKEIEKNVDKVFAPYAPKKAIVKGAKPHPGKLVESAAMSAVSAPNVTYKLHLPKELVTSGKLSDAQLESITYAHQAFQQHLADGKRKGFFLGDGTGVGKGRQICGTILESFQNGQKKAIWVTKNDQLLPDAKRDWSDLGGSEKDVFMLPKSPKAAVKQEGGVLLVPYGTLKYGYGKSSMPDRMKQIEDWLGKDFSGVMVFDESHMMGNSGQGSGGWNKSSKTGTATALSGIKLQNDLPEASVMYCSATGATEIANLGYATRLGLWGKGTQFADAKEFTAQMAQGGVAAMEVVARDMKAEGVYLARSVSAEDVRYDRVVHELSGEDRYAYDTYGDAWQVVIQNVEKALETVGASKSRAARSAAMQGFYANQQRFYSQILTTLTVPTVIKNIEKNLADGDSVVIQMTDTGEAKLNKELQKHSEEDIDLDELDMTPRELITSYVEKSFPVILQEEYTDDNGNLQVRDVVDSNGQPVISKKAVAMRDELLDRLNDIAFPDSPLDMIINAFGTDNVAEVTGRTKRLVYENAQDGTRKRVLQTRSNAMAEADAQDFQAGKKRILIFTKAGGTGKSYHADKRAKNQQQRHLYVLQAGWNAADALQGLGRVNRTNQVSSPIMHLVTTDVPGHKRFVTTIAKRLAQLGALTKGQRESSEGLFTAADDLESDIAATTLSKYYATINPEILRKMGLYDMVFSQGNGRTVARGADANMRNVPRFLNRMLALNIDEQTEVFDGFWDALQTNVQIAEENGTLEKGMENRFVETAQVSKDVTINTDESGAETHMLMLETEVKPELFKWANIEGRGDRFLGIYRLNSNDELRAVFKASDATDAKTGHVTHRVIMQSIIKGQSNTVSENNLDKATKLPKSEWKTEWETALKEAPKTVPQTTNILTGALLPVWKNIQTNASTKVQRIVTADGATYLGRVYSKGDANDILRKFGKGDEVTTTTASPADIQKAVLSGKTAMFPGGTNIKRSRVAGEWRMELTGGSIYYLLSKVGNSIITEQEGSRKRYFIPTGEKGNAVIDQLIQLRGGLQGYLDGATGQQVAPQADLAGETSLADRWKPAATVSPTGKIYSPAELVEMISKDFGVPISKGKVQSRNARGEYNPAFDSVHIRESGNVPTAIHEIGHHLDTAFEFTETVSENTRAELINHLSQETIEAYKNQGRTQLAREGFAEFLREYFRDKNSAIKGWPKTWAEYSDIIDDDTRKTVDAVADYVSAYYADSGKTAQSSIKLREEEAPDFRSKTEKMETVLDRFYQEMVDSKHGVKLLSNAGGDQTAYRLALNSANVDARAHNIIIGDLFDINANKVSPGLRTVLSGIDLADKQTYSDFGEYLVVKHGPERLAEGMRVFANDVQNTEEWMNNRQAQLEEENPGFKEASEKLYSFWHTFMQTWGVDTGLISQSDLDEYEERWNYYVPFNRVVTNKNGRSFRRGNKQDNTIRRAHGSGLDIINPIDNILGRMHDMISASVQNQARQEAAKLAQTKHLGEFMERVRNDIDMTRFGLDEVKENARNTIYQALPDQAFSNEESVNHLIDELIPDVVTRIRNADPNGDTITILRGGKPEYWKVNDPLLLESLLDMTPVHVRSIEKWAGMINRFITGNITGHNLLWALTSNDIRDVMTAVTYDKSHNPFKLLAGIGDEYAQAVRSLSDATRASSIYQEYLAMGGGAGERASAKQFPKSVRGKVTGKRYTPLNLPFNPLDAVSFVTDTVEQGPRFAIYKALRAKGFSPDQAIYEANDITVNFARGGKVSRSIAKFVPFFNAGVQGTDKFVRYYTAEDVKDGGKSKAIVGRASTWILSGALMAIISHLLNRRDDEEKKNYDRLSNYTKNSYFLMSLGDGRYFALPKARELSVMESFFERTLDRLGGNENAYDEFGGYVTEAFLPAFAADIADAFISVPTEGGQGFLDRLTDSVNNLGIIGILHDVSANRDFLGRPIVSQSLSYLPSELQYDRRTSYAAYVLGKWLKVSPKQVDYIGQNLLGGKWKFQKALIPVGEEHRDMSAGIKNQFVKDSLYSTDIVDRMYDAQSDAETALKLDESDSQAKIDKKWLDIVSGFYSQYYKLSKDERESSAARETRSQVLDIVDETTYNVTHHLPLPTQAQMELCAEITGETDFFPQVLGGQFTVKLAEWDDDAGDYKSFTADLTAAQYVAYQTAYNKYYYNYASDLLASCNSEDDFKSAANALSKYKAVAKQEAMKTVYKRLTGDDLPETAFLTDAQKRNVSAASEVLPDFDMETYPDFRDTLSDFDYDASGKANQQEISAAVEAYASQHPDYDTEVLAALWQLAAAANNTKTGANNPYDTEIGQLIMDAIQERKKEQE